MAWFQKLCRNSGLLVHDVIHAGSKRRVTHQEVEEKKVNPGVTLRRTTIDEIEYKNPSEIKDNHQGHQEHQAHGDKAGTREAPNR